MKIVKRDRHSSIRCTAEDLGVLLLAVTYARNNLSLLSLDSSHYMLRLLFRDAATQQDWQRHLTQLEQLMRGLLPEQNTILPLPQFALLSAVVAEVSDHFLYYGFDESAVKFLPSHRAHLVRLQEVFQSAMAVPS